MTIGVQREKLPDWWDRVAECINCEVFASELNADQQQHIAQLLREMVDVQQDILGKKEPSEAARKRFG